MSANVVVFLLFLPLILWEINTMFKNYKQYKEEGPKTFDDNIFPKRYR